MPDGSNLRTVATSSVAPLSFSVDAIVHAVLPLIVDNPAFDCRLADGKTELDVVHALGPLIGDYTVRDGVTLYAALFAEMNANDQGSGDVTWRAIFQAWCVMEEFVCYAHASTPECTSARAHFIQLKQLSDPDSDDYCDKALLKSVEWDVKALRRSYFGGDLFYPANTELGAPPHWFKRRNEHVACWKAQNS